jgi:hypothetical protein
MEKLCFLFGHRDAPNTLAPLLDAALEQHCDRHGIRVFVVGSRGHFDRMAAAALNRLKARRPQVRVLLLLAYHPARQQRDVPAGFDGTWYPDGMETVPHRLAIVRANHIALRAAHSVICFVSGPGNTRTLLEHALTQRDPPAVTNLADTDFTP